jgi:hypothetical protein
MLAGWQARRSPEHLIGIFELAAAAGALHDPQLAVGRMSEYLASAPPLRPQPDRGREP